jgi:hypothetical protein
METLNQSTLEYLKDEEIGGVIVRALSALFRTKPDYPITFLEQYLRLYNYNRKMSIKISVNQAQLKSIESKVVEIEYAKWEREQKKKKKFLLNGGYPEKILKEFNNLNDFEVYLKNDLCNSFVFNKFADHVYIGKYQHQSKKVRKVDQIYL